MYSFSIRKKPGCGRPVLPSASSEALGQVRVKSPEEAAWGRGSWGLGQCDGRFYIGFHIVLVIFPFSIPDPQGIGEMPSSPDPRSPIFFEILCGFYSPPPTNTIGWSRPCLPILHPRPIGYRRDAVFSSQPLIFFSKSFARIATLLRQQIR
jgi:hypothetical protein